MSRLYLLGQIILLNQMIIIIYIMLQIKQRFVIIQSGIMISEIS